MHRLGWITPLQSDALPEQVSFGVGTQHFNAKHYLCFSTCSIDRYCRFISALWYDDLQALNF